MYRAAFVLLCACHGVYSDPGSPPMPEPLFAADGGTASQEDQPVMLAAMMTHDIIPDPTETTIEIIEPPLHGTVTTGYTAESPGTYIPFLGFHGVDSFRYRLTDLHGMTATATATVNIAADQIPYEQAVVVDQTPIEGLVSGDLDGDGKTDLVTTDGTAVLVYLNHSTPGHYQLDLTELEAGHAPKAILLADLDGDSRLDIAVAGADGVVILRNHTTGGPLTFDAPVVLSAGSTTAIATGDFNDDGKLDVGSLDGDATTLDVWINQSFPDQLSFFARSSFAVGANPIAVRAVDVDHTGGDDIVVLSAGSQQLSIFTDTTAIGATVPTFNARVDRATGTAPVQLGVTYIGNGYPWVVVIDKDSGLWMYPNSSGTYVDAYVRPLPHGNARGLAPASLGTIDTDFMVSYDGYYSPGLVEQVLITDVNHITTRDMVIGNADTGAELDPQSAAGVVQIDLDGVAPSELVIASQLAPPSDGQTGLIVLFGQ